MDYKMMIIGAGVTGCSLARVLSRYEGSLAVLDRGFDVAEGASKANSGIVHAGFDAKPGTLKAKLNTEGVDLLYPAAKSLRVPYRRNGSMVCAFSPEEEQALEELLQRGYEPAGCCKP
jgi:glycerol-3-phosphate dehydrogenase